MATQFESYQDAARRSGWVAAWQEMLRFVEPLISRAGKYEDTRNAILMRDLCTSQLFLSAAPGGIEPGKLSPKVRTLNEGAIMDKTQPGQRPGESAQEFEDRMRSEATAAGQTVEDYKSQQQADPNAPQSGAAAPE